MILTRSKARSICCEERCICAMSLAALSIPEDQMHMSVNQACSLCMRQKTDQTLMQMRTDYNLGVCTVQHKALYMLCTAFVITAQCGFMMCFRCWQMLDTHHRLRTSREQTCKALLHAHQCRYCTSAACYGTAAAPEAFCASEPHQTGP